MNSQHDQFNHDKSVLKRMLIHTFTNMDKYGPKKFLRVEYGNPIKIAINSRVFCETFEQKGMNYQLSVYLPRCSLVSTENRLDTDIVSSLIVNVVQELGLTEQKLLITDSLKVNDCGFLRFVLNDDRVYIIVKPLEWLENRELDFGESSHASFTINVR